MRFKRFLEERASVREFLDKKVEEEALTKLMRLAREIEQSNDDDIKFVLYKDGSQIYEALKGVGGYSGVMIEGPHYIGIQLKIPSKSSLVRAGFLMEALITKASQLDLSTCWISVREASYENKKILGATEESTIDYITAIGYPKKRAPFDPLPTSSRLAIEDIVYIKEWGNSASIPELDKRGLSDIFYYARFAPSTKNAQPWRFIIDNSQITLAVVNPDEPSSYVDAGIIAYYFQGLTHDLGINNSWKFTNNISVDTNDSYAVVGSFKV